MVRVLLDIHSPALREGLRALLSSNEAIGVVTEGPDFNNASEAEVVITTSASLASSLDRFSEHGMSPAILLLTDSPPRSERLSHFGRVWGLLPLDTSAEELQSAVLALAEGLIVGTGPLLFPSRTEEDGPQTPLTEREAEVLAQLAEGRANKQIASILHISEHTVKFHVSSIYSKLHVSNRTEAVREGLRSGWIAL